MNGEHIRRMPLAELVAAVLPFARARYGDRLDIPRFERAVELAQERATTLVQIAEQAAFLFVPDDELAIDEKSWEKASYHGARERCARRGDRITSRTASGATASSCGPRSSSSG